MVEIEFMSVWDLSWIDFSARIRIHLGSVKGGKRLGFCVGIETVSCWVTEIV